MCWVIATVLSLVGAFGCFAAEPRFAVELPAWVGAVAYSPDGNSLAVGAADGVARVLRASDGREVAVLRGHSDAVEAVAFAPDGTRIITGSLDRTARVWPINTKETQVTLRGHAGAVMSVAVNPEGKLIATASIDTTIKLWDTSTGKLRATLRGHKSWVNAVAFSAGGRSLFSGSSDGTVKIWDVAARRVKTTLEAGTTPHSTPSEVRSVAVSPDGTTLVAGLRYGWIKTWTAPDWRECLTFRGHDGDVWAVALLPADPVLVTADGDWDRPGQFKFWQLATGALLEEIPTSGEVLALVCSPDGRRVAVGCWSKKLEVWDVPEPLRGEREGLRSGVRPAVDEESPLTLFAH